MLPMRVIGRLIGIPEADDERFKRWTTISIVEEPYGPVVSRRCRRDDRLLLMAPSPTARAPRGRHSNTACLRTHRRRATRRRRVLRKSPEVDDRGQDTTSNLISGGLLELSRHPDAIGDLRRDPSLLPAALEEMIRFVPSVICLGRRALRDLEIEQTAIPAGSTVTLFFVSANRDARVFDDPGRFDIRRTPNPHLGFGLGRHFCIGAPLARLEARVMFEELLPASPESRSPRCADSGRTSSPGSTG